MLQVFTLKNGIKVATYSLPKLRSMAFDIAVKGGGMFESEKTSGLSHLMEHLLVEGTPTYPDATSIANFVESIAGYYNAYTASQTIRFFASGPVTHLREIAQLGSEVFFQSLFKDESVEKERSAILEEVLQRQDGLSHKLSKFFCGVRYQDNHPFKLNVETQYNAIPKITKEQMIDWWQTFFVPSNTYIVIVGGFKNSEAKKVITEMFGGYSEKEKAPDFPKIGPAGFSDRTVAIHFDEKLQSCYVDLNFPSLSDKAPIKERITQNLIRNILGGLGSSRLYRLLRHERGLVYSVGAGASSSHDFGTFNISTEVAPQKLDEVIELITKELVQFITIGPTLKELDFAKNYVKNSALMSWDHPSNIAGWIRNDLMWEESVMKPEDSVKITESVKLEDLNQLIKKYWDFSKLNLVIQGPVDESAENVKKYTKMIASIK